MSLHLLSRIATEKPDLSEPLSRQNFQRLFQPVRKSSSLVVCDGFQFDDQGVNWHLPKFMWLGDRGSGVPIRVGFFAGLDTAGLNLSIALAKFVARLETDASATKDYALFFYPVLNPRSADPDPAMADLDGSFWKDSPRPEVWFLEAEMRKILFGGLITFRSTSREQAFASTSSSLLGEEIVRPAMELLRSHLPLPLDAVNVETPSSRTGISIGKFGPLPDVRPIPFQIDLHIPVHAPLEEQFKAVEVFSREVLHRYRAVLSHAQNI